MSQAPPTKIAPARIELKLRKVAQLFDTLDPSPFRESDLDVRAETYIVESALELPKNSPIEIVIHLPYDEFSQASTSDISRAIKGYFLLRSEAVSGEMRELFKTGRLSHKPSVRDTTSKQCVIPTEAEDMLCLFCPCSCPCL